MEEECAPSRSELVHIAAVEVRAHPELYGGLSEGLCDSRGDDHAALLEHQDFVVVRQGRKGGCGVGAGRLLQIVAAGIDGADRVGV